MSIVPADRCLHLASNELLTAQKSGHPEQSIGHALTAIGFIMLAQVQEHALNPEDAASWSPREQGETQ